MQRIGARRLATLDPLTGLSNRLHFNERLAQQIDAAAAGNGRAALLLLDLNGFKAVNDLHGHVAGDRLLQEIAERLRAHAGADDIVARLGGDEFAIIRQHATARQELGTFADGLLRLISAPCQIAGTSLVVSISAGIARIEHETLEAEALIQAADAALYRAKARPGGTYEFAGPAARRPHVVAEPAAA
jgi:diguanylate cyclase (GGDEF)-like protein